MCRYMVFIMCFGYHRFLYTLSFKDQIGSFIEDTRKISSDENVFDKSCTRMLY